MKLKNDKLIINFDNKNLRKIFSLIFTTDIYPVQVIQVTEHIL